MPAFIIVGRILFSVLFIVSGASKLFDIAATADGIASKVVIPSALMGFTTQLEGLTGMPTAHMLAIAVGVLELVCGVFIALNLGARFFSWVLAVFIVVATFSYHDFWNQAGLESTNNLIHALKNLSLVGALFIIAGIDRRPQTSEPAGGV
ncbi:DoxX family protein [Nitrobacter sp. NHB1]|uniref:DoxX family protein n=1 Tax=Nitrobacter sp. NHB1 TaxID=3119830 RepID=UPI0030000265